MWHVSSRSGEAWCELLYFVCLAYDFLLYIHYAEQLAYRLAHLYHCIKMLSV